MIMLQLTKSTHLNTLILDGLTSFALIMNIGNKIENRQPLKSKRKIILIIECFWNVFTVFIPNDIRFW